MSGLKIKRGWMQKTVVVWFGALLCCLLWGSAFPCIKIGYRLFEVDAADTASQILFAGCRFTLAGILAVGIGSVMEGSFLWPEKRAVKEIIWLSLLQTIIQYFFFYMGLAHTSGVKASIIEAINVFIAILVAGVLFHQEKITSRKIVGCVLGFAGVVLINLNGMNFQFSLAGEGAIFFSTIAYAFSSVFVKKFSQKFNPVMLSAYQFIIGGIVLMATGCAMGGHITKVTSAGIGLLIYLAMVSAVAYSLWGILLKYNPVSKVTVFGFMNPVFGVLLSALLLGETDQASGLLGLLSLFLVCVGIYVVNSGNRS
ncbi:DMT family transporter [Blautia sp.]|uniref:DMT family transporter n=1 Tax=Blautia sp. TaxID=1955243 RepID=UPI003A8F3C33